MKTISSRENPRYKELKLLATSAPARRKAGLSLLDGVHLCEAYLDSHGAPQTAVCSEGGARHPEVGALLARCEALGVQVVALPDALYGVLSPVENGIGLLFVIATPQGVLPGVLTESAVLLDGLQDPGNLGSILRSAAAAGIRYAICGQGSVAAWSPKVLRAGMGAHFLMTIVEHADLAVLAASSAVPLIATSSHADGLLYDADLSGPVAWLFGNEGQGVAPELLARAHLRVAIPHPGAVESLNVAACAAICLFEQVRQQMRKQV